MPLYTISSQEGTLDGPGKAALAAEITELHVELAGVPRDWVHVVFQDYPAGNGFTGGRAAATVSLSVAIRTGRSAEYQRTMLARLWALLGSATGAPDGRMVIGIQEVQPGQAMEMGRVMPDVALESN